MLRLCFCTVFCWAVPAMASAAIVVDHSMNRTSWRMSDTLTQYGTWQLVADDITLDAPATIRHITWWGLYELNAAPNPETMRIRFYSARQSDGLPGEVIFEESLLNPSRTATGLVVPHFPPGSGYSGNEYQFESDLPTPISLDAHVTYWLEVAEDSASGATFAWRGASADGTGRAVTHHTYGDWVHGSDFDMAFQLSTVPEPTTLILLVAGFGLMRGRAGRP